MDAVRNKVAESGIVVINLEGFYPKEPVLLFDIKNFLFMEMILKEKDFRASLKEHNWQQYINKTVAITCSADAIVPMWAFMLATSYLQPIAHWVAFGTEDEVKQRLLLQNINEIKPEIYLNKRVVIKGCGRISVGEQAYGEITRVLLPVVQSLMYGEPCSTVPVYKKTRAV